MTKSSTIYLCDKRAEINLRSSSAPATLWKTPIDSFTIYANNYSIDATALHSTKFGELYEIRGPLTGPNGVTLRVRSIWMKEHLSGVTKFITLIPET